MRLRWLLSRVFALATLSLGSAASAQDSVKHVKDVILITDKLEISAKWKALLSAVGTDKFSNLLKLNGELLFESRQSVGFLFDKEALGLNKRAAFGEFLHSAIEALGSGQDMENVKLSDLPGEISDSVRQRFIFHKSVGLEGLDNADFNVSMSTGLILTFENKGRTLKLNYMFPYESPDRSTSVRRRLQPLKRPTASEGPLTRPRLQGNLVSHFSNPFLMSHLLMEFSSMAYLEAARLIRALAASNDVLVDSFWEESMGGNSEADANAHNAQDLQELPDDVRKFLLERIGASYEMFGFASSQDAIEFLRFARIAHCDRKLGFSVGYIVEGESKGSKLTMSTTLDHR